MTHLWPLLLVLAVVSRHHTALVALAALATAGAAAWLAVWSYRSLPPVSVPAPGAPA